MLGSWKFRGSWMRTNPKDGISDNLSAEKFISLLEEMNCTNASATGEALLEYIVENLRSDLFKFISIDTLIHMAYAPLIRNTGNLSGTEFLKRDRAHCPQKQLDLLRKAAINKNELFKPDHDNSYLYEMAVFEICRRNDAALLEIYLDEFNGFCPDDIYDTVFDYYIYMYLPDFDLLEQYNKEQGKHFGDEPGSLSKQKEIVSTETQLHLLDILTSQAEKCNVQRPDALKVLFQHRLMSTRAIFPIKRQKPGWGMEFSTRDTYDTMCTGRILLHYNDRDFAERNCIDPWDLSDMLITSSCGFPVTCTCGFAGDVGIDTLSESWVFENQARLYIPICENIYFFQIENRIDFLNELLLMLRHLVQTLQCHAGWQKAGTAPLDHNDDEDEEYAAFLPHSTSWSSLRNLCKKIANEIDKSK